MSPAKLLMNHPRNNRKKIAGAATLVVGAVVVHRVKLWKEFLSDPETFNVKYPDAQ